MSYFACFFFFKQKTAYEMRISDWSSDVCASDLHGAHLRILIEPRSDAHIGGNVRNTLHHLLINRLFDIKPRPGDADLTRSEERRVGKERVSTCRSRW